MKYTTKMVKDANQIIQHKALLSDVDFFQRGMKKLQRIGYSPGKMSELPFEASFAIVVCASLKWVNIGHMVAEIVDEASNYAQIIVECAQLISHEIDGIVSFGPDYVTLYHPIGDFPPYSHIGEIPKWLIDLSSDGVDIDELQYPPTSSGLAKPTPKPMNAHPNDSRITWSGKGRKPIWIQEHLDNGGCWQDLLICKDAIKQAA